MFFGINLNQITHTSILLEILVILVVYNMLSAEADDEKEQKLDVANIHCKEMRKLHCYDIE